jgi:phage-related protein
MEPLKFLGSSEDDLAAFPREVKQAVGYQLYHVQVGLIPADCQPMLNIGTGAYEIRVHVLGEWRVIYVAKFADAVHVLHVFQNKDTANAQGRY